MLEIFDVSEFISSVPDKAYLTEAKPKSREDRRSLSFQSKNYSSSSVKVITSLREKKILIDKEREERRN